MLQLHLHHLHLRPQQPVLFRSPNSSTCLLPIANVNPTHRRPKPLIGARTVRCMASPGRVKMVEKQIQREISDMLLTDKVLQYAILPEAPWELIGIFPPLPPSATLKSPATCRQHPSVQPGPAFALSKQNRSKFT